MGNHEYCHRCHASQHHIVGECNPRELGRAAAWEAFQSSREKTGDGTDHVAVRALRVLAEQQP